MYSHAQYKCTTFSHSKEEVHQDISLYARKSNPAELHRSLGQELTTTYISDPILGQ